MNGALPAIRSRLPLSGVRVLEYGQYVAAPFASMLLADLGADVIKVEPPHGDQWRRYAPFQDGESRHFYSLNRGKRSVALNLKSDAGRRASRVLIAGADALLHNSLPERARYFGLDRETVGEVNPRCVVVAVSAFGSAGPDAERPGYDLIAQALSGLLLGHPRAGDRVPVRLGGLALADFTAGLLAAVAVLAGLIGRGEGTDAPEFEVSLLGAALALQVQRFVSVAGLEEDRADQTCATPSDLARIAERLAEAERLDPYYRAHACRDGFVAVACLNTDQRVRLCELFGLEDPWAENPQRPPADGYELSWRIQHAATIEREFAELTVAEAEARLGAARVPCGEVRPLAHVFESQQARANGLVQAIYQPGVGSVELLGSVFKVDGVAPRVARPAPALNEHAGELLADDQQAAVT